MFSMAASAHYERLRMDMFEHQMRLTIGLIKQYQHQTSTNDDNHHRPSSFHNMDYKNILLSPHLLVCSLSSLLSGTEKDTRVQLASTLLHHGIDRTSVQQYVNYFCQINREMQSMNSMSLQVDTCMYRNPSFVNEHFKLPDENDKLSKKYQCTLKELHLMNGQEPCLETLATINEDFPESKKPTLSQDEYRSLVSNSTVDTVLVNSVHFRALLSKEFQLKNGEFFKSNGESVKTKFLYKKKSFLFYEDNESKSSTIKINFTHDGSASMVLIMPEETLSLQRFLHKFLDYDALKRILKNLTSRFEVQLSLPKFAFKASANIRNPLQQMRNNLPMLDREQENETIRSIDEKVVLVQRLELEVDEQGEDSQQGLLSKLFVHEETEFRADRPFLFLIVTNGPHKQILFAGVCNDPTQECF